MKTLACLSTTLISTAAIAQSLVADSTFVNPANGHTYFLISTASWTASESFAQSLGGHLVSLNTSAEQQWVYDTYQNFGGGNLDLWIGLNDTANEGVFTWSSGEPVTFTNWASGEPNNQNGTEDFGLMFRRNDVLNRGGQWNDGNNAAPPLFGIAELVPGPGCTSLAALAVSAFGHRRRRNVSH